MTIEIKNLTKVFPDATPLDGFNATVNDGDIIALVGPSGTGKSTLLRCINMIDPPTSGEIYIDGLEITHDKANFEAVRKRMGMVFQSFNLFGHLTVVENVMLALTELKKMSRQEAYDIAMEQLKMVGLAERALKYPDEISGGQKQRVSIARTLAMNPDLILLDEPTSALDPTMVREVENVILKLAKTGKTMMIVTHEMRLARAISNRVFYLDKGMLYEEGTPDQIFEHPVRERTKAFVNHLKTFKYRFNTDEFSLEDYKKVFSEFIENNDMDENIQRGMSKVIYEIAKNFVPSYVGENHPVSVLAEYDQDNNGGKILVYCVSKNDAVAALIENAGKFAKNISNERIEDEDFDRKICVEF